MKQESPGFSHGECQVGGNTFKYSKRGDIVNSDIYIDDGIRLHIFPLPSSHAKGSLGLEINEKYIFTGDALCPAIKHDQLVYNTQILYEEIKTLERLKGSKVIQSHHMSDLYEKTEIIEKLKNIYASRDTSTKICAMGGI